jgi:hypothetical protein
MSKRDVDEAFEWLVVIYGIVNAIIVTYPEYFYWGEQYGMSVSEVAVKSAVLPLIVTALIWIVAKLVTDIRIQVTAKLTAWLFILILVYGKIYSYLGGAGYIPMSSILTGINMLIILIFIPIITYKVVLPRYKEMYPDQNFLRSKTLLISVYILTMILNFSLLLILPRPS